MKIVKKTLITIMLAMCAISAHAEPAPVLPPSPTIPTPTPTQIGIVGNDVIRPTSSANAETYKKVPISKPKIVNYFKRIPKGGLLEIGVILGLSAVDYLLDPANNSVTFNHDPSCSWGGRSYGTPEQHVKRHCGADGTYKLVEHIKTTHPHYDYARFSLSCEPVNTMFCTVAKSDVNLDDMADKVIDNAKNGNPDAVRVINDWADDEIRRNPDAYPDVMPQPQPEPVPNPDPKPNPAPVPSPVPQPTPSPNPSPIGDPKTNPSPNPNAPPSGNPATNPNPADNPSGTPNTQPDPAISPNDGTKPNEQTFKFELPPFCSWASHVCDFIDWVKSEPPKPDEMPKLPIQEVNKDFDINPNLYNAQGQCPAPIAINILFGTIEIPYDFMCQFFIKNSAVVVAIAYLIGAYIVLGKR